MTALTTYADLELTGRIRHRTSLFGKQILQVEEKRQKWRDAKFDDMQRLADILAGRTTP